MSEQIVSLAVMEALPGKEEELLSMLRELYTMLYSKNYCRDSLHRDTSRPDRFVHLRRWTSAQSRAEAQADPDVHRYWLKLPELCIMAAVYETLETVFET